MDGKKMKSTGSWKNRIGSAARNNYEQLRQKIIIKYRKYIM